MNLHLVHALNARRDTGHFPAGDVRRHRRRFSAAGLIRLLTATCVLAVATIAGVQAAPEPSVRVLAAHPVVHAITGHLALNTGIAVELAVPDNLPPTRHSAYFSGRGAGQLNRLAGSADAVVTLRSAWPEDPLYPHARRNNIRIVEIDAARPVDGGLPGVALHRDAAVDGQYSWMDPTNLGRMADIVAHDLQRLAPRDEATIAENLAEFKHRTVILNARVGTVLADKDNLSVFSLSDRLDYLATGFNLELTGRDARDDSTWSPETLDALTKHLTSEGVAAVLHHREPAAEINQAILASGAHLVVLDAAGRDPIAEMMKNLERLDAALGGR